MGQVTWVCLVRGFGLVGVGGPQGRDQVKVDVGGGSGCHYLFGGGKVVIVCVVIMCVLCCWGETGTEWDGGCGVLLMKGPLLVEGSILCVGWVKWGGWGGNRCKGQRCVGQCVKKEEWGGGAGGGSGLSCDNKRAGKTACWWGGSGGCRWSGGTQVGGLTFVVLVEGRAPRPGRGIRGGEQRDNRQTQPEKKNKKGSSNNKEKNPTKTKRKKQKTARAARKKKPKGQTPPDARKRASRPHLFIKPGARIASGCPHIRIWERKTEEKGNAGVTVCVCGEGWGRCDDKSRMYLFCRLFFGGLSWIVLGVVVVFVFLCCSVCLGRLC